MEEACSSPEKKVAVIRENRHLTLCGVSGIFGSGKSSVQGNWQNFKLLMTVISTPLYNSMSYGATVGVRATNSNLNEIYNFVHHMYSFFNLFLTHLTLKLLIYFPIHVILHVPVKSTILSFCFPIFKVF